MKKIFEAIFILFLLISLAGCAGALHSSAAKGDIKALKEMLDGGADINESSMGAMVAGPPLQHASYYCQVEAVRLLLERGADVNAATWKGMTALHWAVTQGCNKVAKLLIDRGAEIDAIDGTGDTPLAWAAQRGQGASVRFLIESGADPDIAVGHLISRKENSAAQLVELAAKSVRKGKTQIATNRETRSPVVQSDIDELPAIMSEPRKNAYAVVIGIENYRSLPKSDYSRNDAVLVKTYLKSLGFQERNIDFITDETATKTDIEKSLEAWLPNRAEKDSLIMVYFSGHGAPEPSTGEAYIVPYDGDPNYLPVTGYSLKRLYERLGKLEAKEIVVVLDSCFSGSGGRSVLAKGARPLVMMADTRIPSSNIAVLTATQESQISTSSPEKGHGIFTYYFLKAIKDGKRNLAEIYEYIKPQVEDEAKQLNIQQSPSLNPGVEKVKGRFSLRK
jgi:Uncharacterized protein containing caspase domain